MACLLAWRDHCSSPWISRVVWSLRYRSRLVTARPSRRLLQQLQSCTTTQRCPRDVSDWLIDGIDRALGTRGTISFPRRKLATSCIRAAATPRWISLTDTDAAVICCRAVVLSNFWRRSVNYLACRPPIVGELPCLGPGSRRVGRLVPVELTDRRRRSWSASPPASHWRSSSAGPVVGAARLLAESRRRASAMSAYTKRRSWPRLNGLWRWTIHPADSD